MTALTQSMPYVPMVVMGMPLVGVAIVAMGVASLLQYFFAIPVVQAIVNTTSVFLNNTQLVWRPAYDASLAVLQPFSKSLRIMTPITDMALIVLEVGVRSMIIFGYYTVLTMRSFSEYAFHFINMTKEAGISLGTALQNTFEATKDFTGAVVTVVRGFGYVTFKTIQGAGYIMNSFEEVSNFMYRFFFETSDITWEDVYNISFPFLIVGSILGYFAWRSYNVLVKPHVYEPKVYNDECEKPRRSSRLARKRAMVTGEDLSALAR
jgi:hypothetical protein